ncbi:Gfo/Idh/MocA family oxidoreductase [Adhaeribacter swui]|uniref:Gfo/Idh/MocA family oxidoreductase n=1 Tax=Adhaeribacter swui TaxID=2086471 RepID=A0A7G7G995_9BACT|nr:Gfo/Idh/MocA family oxidoreductase [Adhaeribacter swui]QNF33729.1 Gfo/Idh/MocA family oxidoreductase [Adhaeribacter swui]
MINSNNNSRREFIKKAGLGSVGLAFGMSAKSYASIMGANDRVRMGFVGVNGRGNGMTKNFARQVGCEVVYVCDVDATAMAKTIAGLENISKKKPKGVKDFRTILNDKNLDGVYIATPDHWHAPAAILACQAGKHVYVEKPCSHNPYEGELLVEAARKYDRIVQMGNQRRSWPRIMECMEELKSGAIGKAYFAKGWYTNNRKPIGKGKQVPVPTNLDYELWQGPAPRKPYQDNLIHYNWHWFWNWGTGEALNNGTHEIDVMRWGLGVEYPTRVTSFGGRYAYQDDWETPDTQVINMEFPGGIAMTWEGRSCNNYPVEGSPRGAIFYGDKGTIVTTGDNDYTIYNMDNKVVKKVQDEAKTNTTDPAGPGDKLDAYHINNFLDSVRNNKRPNGDIEIGHKSVLLCQLGNIAQRTGRVLNCDPKNGHIVNDKEAMALWRREYEPGWEPKLV